MQSVPLPPQLPTYYHPIKTPEVSSWSSSFLPNSEGANGPKLSLRTRFGPYSEPHGRKEKVLPACKPQRPGSPSLGRINAHSPASLVANVAIAPSYCEEDERAKEAAKKEKLRLEHLEYMEYMQFEGVRQSGHKHTCTPLGSNR